MRDANKITDHDVQEHYVGIRSRLLHLCLTEEKHSTNIPPDVHRFTSTEFPGYKKSDIIFAEDPELLVQRHQLSGLCYMHAPAVVQYYAVSKTLGKPYGEMIDLLNVIRKTFPRSELEAHIFNDQGGDSQIFLKKILEVDSVLIPASYDPDSIIDSFQKYGVGLVSRFQVRDDFYDMSIHHHHYAKLKGKVHGYHSMALVGFRIDQGTYYYLLQNWWKDKQFVEVRHDYLKASGAVLFFIETPQNFIPKVFPTHYGKFFETLDKPEGFAGEILT